MPDIFDEVAAQNQSKTGNIFDQVIAANKAKAQGKAKPQPTTKRRDIFR